MGFFFSFEGCYGCKLVCILVFVYVKCCLLNDDSCRIVLLLFILVGNLRAI